MSRTSVIIVTHNSERVIHQAVKCLNEQTVPARKMILVDSGSTNTGYLDRYRKQENAAVKLEQKDIGFCRGNNSGMEEIDPESEFIFFLNPDAFISADFIEKAEKLLDNHSDAGALTGLTLGYDINENSPTGKYDTTGIFHKWYGKWYDRDQGADYDKERYREGESVPAICGAVMFCRKKALDDVRLQNGEIFDSGFYMYKEDIDLSLRMGKKGWKLMFFPELIAYHCRGWNQNRKEMPKKFRICSARNELRIHAKNRHLPGMLYSLAKYAAVRIGNV